LLSGSATATGGHEPLTDGDGDRSPPLDRWGHRASSGWASTSHCTGPTPPLRSTSGGVMLQAPHLHPLVDAAEASLVEPDSERTPADPVPRQCGRCQLMFAGDPTLYPPARPDWWACPRCRDSLFRRHAAPNGIARPRRTGDTS
jgi:hypothetical protein